MALRYQNPGALSPIVYTSTIYGLTYDLLVFHIYYNSITWLGIGFVISANIYHVYMIISERYILLYDRSSAVTYSNQSTNESPGREDEIIPRNMTI